MSKRIQKPRGTRDILPDEYAFREKLLEKAFKIIKTYGYRFIVTPTFEYTQLFTRTIGETTDIVEKEMFRFQDRGGRDLALRPEGTAPVIRAFLENRLIPPSKIAYFMNMFRAERPQKGRYREFWQIGVEAIGMKDPLIDAEVIELGARLLQEFGLENFIVEINSVGTKDEREAYKRALLDYIEEIEAQGEITLCEDCQRRKESNPLRILDCRTDGPKLHNAPTILEFLSEDSYRYFEEVQKYLKKWGVDFVINPRLVRGLDYYTHTAFEIKLKEIGAQDALIGGGRYDTLVEDLGGPATPAVGFAMGFDRVIVALGNIPRIKGPFYFVATVGDFARGYGIGLLRKIRNMGVPADMSYEIKSLKAQMKIADRIGAVKAVIVGEEEINRGKVRVRDMETGEELLVEEDKLRDLYEEELKRKKT